ncbi:phosphatase PAP2 family protein [Mesonia aestuariivivens]|uniref:Phosphatase PAP2 family protein n=1 Tax=Mesonia aestuariivivens TaxID=2796128 RepID=A0ABS6W6R8_9FLAO|nr:phosphatase PAP2 family protein [Mesonia aestuariivivens]MBW2962834.1 phosphatase PAP2 family protein [Mesonia aestuariivivens]
MKKFLSFLFLVLFLNSVTAQIDSLQIPLEEKITTWDLAKNDAGLMWGGFKQVYTSPLQWKQDDWAIAAGIVIGTAGLNIIDEDAHQYFANQEDKVPGVIKEFGWYFGSPQNNYGVNGAIYLTGLFTKSKKLRKTGILMISSASAAGLIQTFSKNIAGRARPQAGSKATFKPFSKEGAYHSFPSGHTILSFTTFYALSKQFDNIWVKGALIAGGMVSPVSRLWQQAHWLTDVALSTALTVVVVDSIDKYLDRAMSDDPAYREHNKKISWRLQFGGNRIGVIGTF